MSVENLRGSAMIAGETSTAYDDIFTVTIVTNRAIGIGAYLARLGQRIIQVNNIFILLNSSQCPPVCSFFDELRWSGWAFKRPDLTHLVFATWIPPLLYLYCSISFNTVQIFSVAWPTYWPQFGLSSTTGQMMTFAKCVMPTVGCPKYLWAVLTFRCI